MNSYNKVQSRVTHKITVKQEVKKEKSIKPYQIAVLRVGRQGRFAVCSSHFFLPFNPVAEPGKC